MYCCVTAINGQDTLTLVPEMGQLSLLLHSRDVIDKMKLVQCRKLEKIRTHTNIAHSIAQIKDSLEHSHRAPYFTSTDVQNSSE